MRRTFAFVGVFALMMSMLALPATASDEAPPPTTTYYTGQGMTDEGPESEKCDELADTGQDTDFVIDDDGGYLKWVLTATDATYAKLIGPWGEFEMIQAGGGAWHKATDYYPLSELVPDKVYAEHDGTGNIQLTVSNGCPGDFVLGGRDHHREDGCPDLHTDPQVGHRQDGRDRVRAQARRGPEDLAIHGRLR
jgi:hypothetical protein